MINLALAPYKIYVNERKGISMSTSDHDWRAEWQAWAIELSVEDDVEFCELMERRLKQGEKDYGDSTYGKSLKEIGVESSEEAADYRRMADVWVHAGMPNCSIALPPRYDRGGRDGL